MPDFKPTLVLRGYFNPAIITPKWMADQEIITEALSPTQLNEIGMAVEFKEGFSGGFHRDIRFTVGGIDWAVSDLKIKLEPTSVSTDTPELLQKVLSKLPHTPVTGVGHNLSAKFTRQEWENRLPHLQPQVEDHLTSIGTVATQAHSFSIAMSGDRFCNLGIREDAASVSVDINIHYEIKSTEHAVEVIAKFNDDIEWAKTISTNLAAGATS